MRLEFIVKDSDNDLYTHTHTYTVPIINACLSMFICKQFNTFILEILSSSLFLFSNRFLSKSSILIFSLIHLWCGSLYFASNVERCKMKSVHLIFLTPKSISMEEMIKTVFGAVDLVSHFTELIKKGGTRQRYFKRMPTQLLNSFYVNNKMKGNNNGSFFFFKTHKKVKSKNLDNSRNLNKENKLSQF